MRQALVPSSVILQTGPGAKRVRYSEGDEGRRWGCLALTDRVIMPRLPGQRGEERVPG
jgi:hypothetical protein